MRCGNKLDKVEICHQVPGNPGVYKTLCIKQADVAYHLAHGDQLGACGIDRSCNDNKSGEAIMPGSDLTNEDGMSLKVYPNPAAGSVKVSYMVPGPGRVTIRLTNLMGKSVLPIFDGNVPAEGTQHLECGLESLSPGIYLVVMQQVNGDVVIEKLVVQR